MLRGGAKRSPELASGRSEAESRTCFGRQFEAQPKPRTRFGAQRSVVPNLLREAVFLVAVAVAVAVGNSSALPQYSNSSFSQGYPNRNIPFTSVSTFFGTMPSQPGSPWRMSCSTSFQKMCSTFLSNNSTSAIWRLSSRWRYSDLKPSGMGRFWAVIKSSLPSWCEG